MSNCTPAQIRKLQYDAAVHGACLTVPGDPDHTASELREEFPSIMYAIEHAYGEQRFVTVTVKKWVVRFEPELATFVLTKPGQTKRFAAQFVGAMLMLLKPTAAQTLAILALPATPYTT